MSINDVTRWVLVDDSDSRIQYSASGWFSDQGSRDFSGTSGAPYQSTLHGTKSNASASFAFTGSSVRVIGSSDVHNISGVVDPSWDCLIDNIRIRTSAPAKASEDNQVLCEQSGLTEGPHFITVNAIVLQEQTFWLDQIQYAPSPSVPLNAESVLISNDDSSLHFDDGWISFTGNNTSITNAPNSSLSVSFSGVSLTWYGFISTSFPRTATNGSYCIDGGEVFLFPLRGVLPNKDKTSNDNQIFFQTKSNQAGTHNITVTYLGNQNTVPLTLDHIVVQNGTLSDFATTPSTRSSRSSQIGLVGGVVGILVFLILASIISFLYFRRRKRRKEEGDQKDISGPSSVEPFRGGPTAPRQSSQIARIIAKTAHRLTFPNATATELESPMPLPSQSSPRTFLNSNMRQQPQSTSLSDDGDISPSQRVVHHEDSGARFRGDNRESEVVEVPPVYTDV